MNYYDTNIYHIKYAGSIIKIKMRNIARLLPCTAQRISACKKVVCVTYNLLPRLARRCRASNTTYLCAWIRSCAP